MKKALCVIKRDLAKSGSSLGQPAKIRKAKKLTSIAMIMRISAKSDKTFVLICPTSGALPPQMNSEPKAIAAAIIPTIFAKIKACLSL